MYRKFALIFFIFYNCYAFVQTSENSAYSSWGIGNTGFYGNAYTNSMGGISTVLVDSSQSNIFNPASYSLLAKQLPLFSFGMTHVEKKFSDKNGNTTGRFTGITHFSLAIPFGKRFGMAAGLKPLSRVGYEISAAEKIQEDSIFYNYKGAGDIQQAFLGLSYNILNVNKHRFSVGINGLRYFGRIDRERKSYRIIGTKETGGVDINSLSAAGWGAELGLYYHYQPNLAHRISAGAIYNPQVKSKFGNEIVRYAYTDFLNPGTYDTVINNEMSSGEIVLPTRLTVGLSYTYTPTNEERAGNSNLPSLKVALEYAAENWSSYEERFGTNIQQQIFVNSNAYRLGIEFIPHRIAVDHSATIRYFSKWSYRIGAYYLTTPHKVANTQLINKGISVGISLPFIINRSVSTINISGGYGVFGDKNVPSVTQENYYGINFGINIAPGYDRWFRKYKLD